MVKDKRFTTKWWTTNHDDALQIAEYFHGFGKTGHYNFPTYRKMIEDAVVGEPKKEVLFLLEYFMAIDVERGELLASGEGDDVEPFIAARVWDAWARNKGRGKYRKREVSLDREVA